MGGVLPAESGPIRWTDCERHPLGCVALVWPLLTGRKTPTEKGTHADPRRSSRDSVSCGTKC